MWPIVRSALLDAWAVLAPVDCAGCGAPDRGVCDDCRAALAAAAPTRESLRRADGSELTVWRALEYGGVARSALAAFKDGGRTDAAPPLAAVLRSTIRAALAAAPPEARGRIELAAIPSTRAAFRRRGYAPVRLLLAKAGYRESGLLRATRQTQDQSDLDTTQRFANLEQSLTVETAHPRRFIVLIDDIVTTGATVLEADRAFRAACHEVLCAVAVARTPRRIPMLRAQSEIGRKAP